MVSHWKRSEQDALREPLEELLTASVVSVPAHGKTALENQDRVKVWHTTPTHIHRTILSGMKGYLFAVADGMGGQGQKNSGRRASEIAIETLEDYYTFSFPTIMPPQDQATAIIYNAHRKILDLSEKDPGRYGEMGTTLAATLLLYNKQFEEYTAHIFNVGDSRVYIVRNSSLQQYTTDDVAAPGSSHLTQYLGKSGTQSIHVHHQEIQGISSGDYILLCTDGAYRLFRSEEDFLSIVLQYSSPVRICAAFQQRHFSLDGFDDMGLVVVEIN